MNRNVLVLALFCFIVLESSEDKKCSAEDFSLVQSPKLKKVKHDSAAPELQQNPIALPAPIAPIIQKQPQQKITIKSDPRKFHFKEWKEPVRPKQGPVDTPTSLSQINLQQMRKKMSSVSHCLKGDALLLRKNELDEGSLFDVSHQEVKSLLQDVARVRVLSSSSPVEKMIKVQPKQLRNCFNSYTLRYCLALGHIDSEVYAREIIDFIEGDLQGIKQDAHDEYFDAFQQNKIAESTGQIKNKQFTLRFTVKNIEIINSVLHNYTALKNHSFMFPTQDAQSRSLFNQLESLQQAVICDDFVTKTSLQGRYQEMVQFYQTIEPTLSEQVKMYAQPSFASLKKSIAEFEEN